MKLPSLNLSRPTIPGMWARCAGWPYGNLVFSKLLGRMVPYSGTVSPVVLELADGYARVQIADRHGVRNHLRSVHAIALMNLGELATGLAVMHYVDGRGRGIVTELCMDYTKKARGTITGTCRVSDLPTTSGTHYVEAVAELTDSSGEQVARARAQWKIDL